MGPFNQLPDWEEVYASGDPRQMPWYFPALDPDLYKFLKAYGERSGAFLDIGTGAGSQAGALARMGFTVTGTDIVERALDTARANHSGARFVRDDILDTDLSETFRFAFDRGLFHVFHPGARLQYLENVAGLLEPGGILFLKCFSERMPPGNFGPYRYSPAALERLFGLYFDVADVRDAYYQGPQGNMAHALFAVFVKA